MKVRTAWFLLFVVIAYIQCVKHEAAAIDREECKFNGWREGTWTYAEIRRTAWCVVEKWPVPGGHNKFNQVADCESNWNRFASNDGRYLGLFQHARPYWGSRVNTFEPPRWELQEGWANPRTQIVVTARMVRAGGWGPWSCA